MDCRRASREGSDHEVDERAHGDWLKKLRGSPATVSRDVRQTFGRRSAFESPKTKQLTSRALLPFVSSRIFALRSGPEQTQYLISAALIMTGISSFIQVSQIRIPHTKIVIGTGVVSMIGTALTFLPASVDALHQVRSRQRAGLNARPVD